MSNYQRILDYVYPDGKLYLDPIHRQRAVERVTAAKRLYPRLPRIGGEYRENLCLTWNSFQWCRHGFSIQRALEGVPGPFFEIGGPTRKTSGGYSLGERESVWDVEFSPEMASRPMYCSDYMSNPAGANESLEREPDSNDCGPYYGQLAVVCDGAQLPIRSGSISAVFARAVGWLPRIWQESYATLREIRFTNIVLHSMIIEEVWRILPPGGLFFYACINRDIASLCLLQGFQTERYTGMYVLNRIPHHYDQTAFSKPALS